MVHGSVYLDQGQEACLLVGGCSHFQTVKTKTVYGPSKRKMMGAPSPYTHTLHLPWFPLPHSAILHTLPHFNLVVALSLTLWLIPYIYISTDKYAMSMKARQCPRLLLFWRHELVCWEKMTVAGDWWGAGRRSHPPRHPKGSTLTGLLCTPTKIRWQPIQTLHYETHKMHPADRGVFRCLNSGRPGSGCRGPG